ncbi:AI-2E family transporter [Baekduia soli]|uniref:AI-2E family transporter n=1 Tax=Baekduia soli TaxID=496014 RepID=A0A5B8UB27_9ACTN|nr:AI-2E family transporter [Baekduia soli]QEC50207.1 AI-2E family transporter [Baekduia soli]
MPSRPAEMPIRSIARVVMIVVVAVLILYLIYLLRKPIGWVLTATFIAIALSGPVNRLGRHMRRGFAITVVYLGLILVPAGLTAIVVPPLVTQGTDLAQNLPQYANDIRDFVNKNERLRKLDDKYDITGSINKQADKLPARIGDAAKVLGDIGLGLVNSVFALVNILILSIFIVAGGRRWTDAALGLRPELERRRLRRVLDDTAAAVGGYVRGALTIALIAGVQAFIVMEILGVPFAAPLAVLAGLLSLIPLVGATVAAVIIGLVTLFNDFPTDTIIWAVWAIVYQQIENNVIQPQVQRRTVQVQPFIVLVAVLFGSTLIGILGAIVAIPLAASLQIVVREWWDWRQEVRLAQIRDPEGPQPPGPPGSAPPDDEGGTGIILPAT